MSNLLDNTVFHISIGVILATLLLWILSRLSNKTRHFILFAGLMVAAFIYLLFALINFNLQWIFVESGGLTVFVIMSIIGLKKHPLFLGVGWLVHILWDVCLHTDPTTSFIPSWYPMFCVGFDLVIACYLIVISLKQPTHSMAFITPSKE